jgi:predicted transcriptional regulator
MSNQVKSKAMSQKRNNQFQQIVIALKKNEPMTMKELDKYSGIMRENICRYIKMLRDEKEIFKLKKRYCRITGHLAYEYSLNPKYKPKAQQLEFNF